MRYRDRDGNTAGETSGQDRFLDYLYGTVAGRRLVRFLIRPGVSRLGGAILSTRLSKGLIRPFIRRTGIRLEEYEIQNPFGYASYNDFFSRKIRQECRHICTAPEALISPCDGKASIYPIDMTSSFHIKNTAYTVESLLRSKRLAEHYNGGYACVFRLTVDDYHRYCYAESGLKSRQYRIPGVFHTVNPVANDHYPIYKENTREYCLIKTSGIGTIIQMEVGALMVGTIRNYSQGGQTVLRGQEKGRFEFGGSTIVVLAEPGKIIPDPDILCNSEDGWETVVKMGEIIGTHQSRNS